VGQAYVDAGSSPTEAVRSVEASYYAVIEAYASDCPGYAGKIVLEIAGAGPSYYSVFVARPEGSGLQKLDRAPEL